MARCEFPKALAMAALLLVTILGAGVPANAQPPSVTFNWISLGGSGCSWSDTSFAFSNNYKTATVMFGGMIATTDSGLAGQRKNCQLSLSLNYPDGWSVSLGTVTGRGFADIGEGSKGFYETSYYWSGQQGTARIRRTIYGKFTGDYEFTDNFLTLVYSQCNSAPNLNINTAVRVEGKKAVMTLDSSDQKFKLLFALLWKNC